MKVGKRDIQAVRNIYFKINLIGRPWRMGKRFGKISVDTYMGNMTSQIRPISLLMVMVHRGFVMVSITSQVPFTHMTVITRSEEHTSELQSRFDLVCRLLLEKKKE